MVVVGIDLGSTRSFVAVSQRKTITVIENDRGARATPSCVSFTEGQRFVGEVALQQLTRDPENTIYHMKDIIGQTYAAVEQNFDIWPIKAVEENSRLKIQFQYKGRNETLLPEEILSMIFARLKEIAEVYLQHSHTGTWPKNLQQVTGAVITVPASFNSIQRRAMKDAARIAGLPVVGLINETVAAAIDFALKTGPVGKKNVMVFHLGGGFFEVTILTIQNGVFEVKTHQWSLDVGGDIFHSRMSDYILENERNQVKDYVRKNAKAHNKLRMACEKAKKELCLSKKVCVKAEALMGGEDLEKSITMAVFESENRRHCDIMEQVVHKALNKAGMKPNEVHDIVLAGGGTRMPMIVDILVKCGFQKSILRKTVNSDEAAVLGAAAYAAALSCKIDESENIVVQDVISHPLHLDSEYGRDTLVQKGSCIPFQRWRDLPKNFQLTCGAPEARQSFTVTDFSTGPNQDKSVGILFEVDAGGLFLLKSYKDGEQSTMSTGMKQAMIDHLKQKAAKWLNEERERRETENRLHKVESDAHSAITILRQYPVHSGQQELVRKCEEILERIETALSFPNPKKLQEDETFLGELLRKLLQRPKSANLASGQRRQTPRDKVQRPIHEPMEQEENPDRSTVKADNATLKKKIEKSKNSTTLNASERQARRSEDPMQSGLRSAEDNMAKRLAAERQRSQQCGIAVQETTTYHTVNSTAERQRSQRAHQSRVSAQEVGAFNTKKATAEHQQSQSGYPSGMSIERGGVRRAIKIETK